MGGVDAFLAWQIGSLTPKINICDFTSPTPSSETTQRSTTVCRYCLIYKFHRRIVCTVRSVSTDTQEELAFAVQRGEVVQRTRRPRYVVKSQGNDKTIVPIRHWNGSLVKLRGIKASVRTGFSNLTTSLFRITTSFPLSHAPEQYLESINPNTSVESKAHLLSHRVGIPQFQQPQ